MDAYEELETTVLFATVDFLIVLVSLNFSIRLCRLHILSGYLIATQILGVSCVFQLLFLWHILLANVLVDVSRLTICACSELILLLLLH